MITGFNWVGLEASALLFLSVSLFILGHRGPIKLIILPLVMTGLIVLIFKYFLDVFFPTPLLAEWLWE
jgi:energy-converting hydrogenase Eha subunit C